MKKENRKIRRKKRVRGKTFGTDKKPRLNVFRSNKHIYAQLVGNKGRILIGMSDKGLTKRKVEKSNKTEIAKFLGEELAKSAKRKKILTVIFDRGGYKYHGRVKALAEGARKGGLKF